MYFSKFLSVFVLLITELLLGVPGFIESTLEKCFKDYLGFKLSSDVSVSLLYTVYALPLRGLGTLLKHLDNISISNTMIGDMKTLFSSSVNQMPIGTL